MEEGIVPIDYKKRIELKTLVVKFTDAFNREDIEGVMSFFSEDSVYLEFNGKKNVGLAAIREAFTPQFSGVFGRMRFYTEDIFLDDGAGKAMVRWLLTLEEQKRAGAYYGLDLLHFVNGKVLEKHTYCKATVPLILKKDQMLLEGKWPA
tara:strand:- start:4425 stop:4871 length:447 start_codon:yes stop_codon:yes gene_type:complete